MDSTAWTVGITSSVTAILTLLCTKGVDAILKIRRDRREDRKLSNEEIMEDRKYSDGEAAKAYDKLTSQFEVRIATLEAEQKALLTELKETRAEHVKCQVEHAALRGEFKALQVHVERLWKHDEANRQQVDMLTKAVKEEGGKA